MGVILIHYTNYEMPVYPNNRLPFWCGVNGGFPHWHWHKAPELLYGLTGQSLVYCNDRKHLLKPQDTVFVNSEVLHAIESEPGATYLALRPDPCFFSENGLPLDRWFFTEYVKKNDRMTVLWQAVYDIQMAEKDAFRVAKYRCAVLALLIEFFENYRNDKSEQGRMKEKYHDVKAAITYIEENFTQSLTLDKISKSVGVSKYHLARLFKECTNRTMVEFIVISRVNFAKNLLRSTDLSVKEVAFSAGFKNAPYFSKVFRKHLSCTPVEYRALFQS